MRRLHAAAVALGATATLVVGAGTAQAADPGNSDAAHMCLDGPQIDEYYVAGQPGQEADVDFGSLAHGVVRTDRVPIAEGSAWVETDSHGQCASFFAAAKKGTGSGGKPKPKDIVFTHTYDKSSPIFF